VFGRVVSLVLALVLLVVGVAMRRDPAWFVDRSPATKYDPTVDRAVFVQQVRRMGLWGSVGGAVLVPVGLLVLAAHLAQ
jgi:hypothetical protein